jgi:hypothetical protein
MRVTTASVIWRRITAVVVGQVSCPSMTAVTVGNDDGDSNDGDSDVAIPGDWRRAAVSGIDGSGGNEDGVGHNGDEATTLPGYDGHD